MKIIHFPPDLPENMPGVVDVRFIEREPAEKRRLLSWEQVNYFTHELMQFVSSFCVSVSFGVFSSFFFLEKHLHSARGPARFLSDN